MENYNNESIFLEIPSYKSNKHVFMKELEKNTNLAIEIQNKLLSKPKIIVKSEDSFSRNLKNKKMLKFTQKSEINDKLKF